MEKEGIIRRIYFSVKGYFKKKKFAINSTYFGGKNYKYGIYVGNGYFLETDVYTVPIYGTSYCNGKNVHYSNYDIGKYIWERYNC